jgi:hypothetical protein
MAMTRHNTADLVILAEKTGLTPDQVKAGIALARTGRVDLLDAVITGRMTVQAALAAARRHPVNA